jgi:hypothetical protein
MLPNYLDIYDDTISRRVNSSDAEKFAEICPCPCNGVGWGVIWYALHFSIFLLLMMLFEVNTDSKRRLFLLKPYILCFRGFISFIFLCASIYLGLVILS